MSIRLPWRKAHKLDQRVAEARQRAADAATELELSRARAHDTRERLVEPLHRRDEDNQFAEILRRSLRIGYGNGNSA